MPIVFATYPLLAGVKKAELIFDLVFFISVTSVLLQGTTLSYVAKLLHVDLPPKAKRRVGFDFEAGDNIKSEMQEVIIDHSAFAVGRRIVDLHVPSTVNILAIKRGPYFIAPNGETKLLENDLLQVLAEDSKALEQFYEALGIRRLSL